jgi:hypothetical protein
VAAVWVPWPVAVGISDDRNWQFIVVRIGTRNVICCDFTYAIGIELVELRRLWNRESSLFTVDMVT